MGNRLGRAPLGRSGTEATSRWTEGKAWEIAWVELRWGEAIRKRRQGGRRRSVGNSLGRAPWGRSGMEATTGWTEGKPWAIACGEKFVGKERDGSDDKVDGRETVGNGLGRDP